MPYESLPRPSRRSLLRAISGITLLASGCVPLPTAGPVRTPTASPTPSGPLALGIAVKGEIGSLDPHATDTFAAQVVHRAYAEPLIDYVERGRLTPLLAESWEAPDALTYIFKLARGAKFQDGTAVNAEAVKWNFERMAALRKSAAGRLPEIQKIDAVDAQTVRLTLKTPFTPFLEGLPKYGLLVSPAGRRPGDDWAERAYATAPVGSGPYRLAPDPGKGSYTMVRQPEYWRGPNNQPSPSITVRPAKEATVHRLLLETGEVALADGVATEEVAALARLRGITFDEVDGATVWQLQLRQRGPLANRRIRVAVQAAIDFEAVAGIWNGKAQAANGPFAPAIWTHDSAAPRLVRDLELAKRSFVESNPSGPIWLIIATSPVFGPQAAKVAQVIQNSLREAGIASSIEERADLAGFLGMFTANSGPDIAVTSYTWSSEDPDEYLRRVILGAAAVPAGGNLGFYRNNEVDRLITEAQRIPGREGRAPVYRAAAKLIADDIAVVPLVFPRTLMGRRAGLRGLPVHPLLGSIVWDYTRLSYQRQP